MSELDNLKRVWQQQPIDKTVELFNKKNSITDIKKKAEAFNKSIFWRDIRESFAAVILCIIFIYQGFHSSNSVYKAGCFISAAGCIFIAIFLYIKKMQFSKTDYTEDINHNLKNSLSQVNAQIWLLRNVFWWYLLPLIPGIFIQNFTHESISKVWIFNIVTVLILILVYWLNQWAVKKSLLPLKSDLEAIISETELQKDNDGTN